MALIPQGIVRISLNWKPNASDWPNEIAVNTFHVKYTPTIPPADWSTALQEISNSVANKLETHWGGSLAVIFGSGYGIKEVGAAALDQNGKTTDETVTAIAGGACDGSGSGGIMPPEVAVALGLYNYQPGTFTPKRGQKRGRMYLPYINGTLAGNDGKVTSTGTDAITSGWKAFFDDLSSSTVADGSVDVGILSVAGGAFYTLNWLSVDNFFDSQRRRQHQAPAIRTTVQITP